MLIRWKRIGLSYRFALHSHVFLSFVVVVFLFLCLCCVVVLVSSSCVPSGCGWCSWDARCRFLLVVLLGVVCDFCGRFFSSIVFAVSLFCFRVPVCLFLFVFLRAVVVKIKIIFVPD